MEDQDSRKGKNKEKIRKAAIDLFEKHGFKKVSINDIADKAGISPVTIYNHFGNKDELIRDTIKTISTILLEKIRGIVNSDKSFLEKLDTIIFDKTKVANQYQGELIQSVIYNDPELYEFINNIRLNEVNKLMLDLFEQGKKQGYISPELSKEAILLYTEILRRGIFAIPDFSEKTKSNPYITREIISLAVYGLNG
jgi:AcrR family transcriptional regulator